MRQFLARHGDSLFAHASVQLGARAYTAASQLAAFALVGFLGSDTLVSVYALSMAAAGLVATAVDLGSGLWIVQRIAAGGDLPRLLVPRLVGIAFCALALLAVSEAGVVPLSTTPWILITGFVVGSSSLWRGVLWARLRYGSEAGAAVLQATALAVGLALALFLGWTAAAAPMVVASFAYGLGYLARVRMARGLVNRENAFMGLSSWVKHVYSYAGQALVVSAQTQADLLLLGALWAGPTAGVAAYGLAMRFYYSIGMPFESLGAAILPRVAMHEAIAWKRVLKVALPAGVLGVAAMLLLTSAGTLFGVSREASEYLHYLGLLLALALPFRFASYILGAIVTGSGKQSARFRAATVGLTTMLVLDLWLIPIEGPYGAAVALILADIVLMSGYAWATRKAFRSAV